MGVVRMNGDAVLARRRAVRGELARQPRSVRAPRRSAPAERVLYVVPAEGSAVAGVRGVEPSQGVERAAVAVPRAREGGVEAPRRPSGQVERAGGRAPARRGARGTPRRGDDRYVPVRLTRRGKVVAQILLVAAAVLVVVGVAAGARAVTESPAPAGSGPSVVVRPGDTLWNIASRHAPGADRRETIKEIRRLNHLDGSSVEVGQKLVLPRR